MLTSTTFSAARVNSLALCTGAVIAPEPHDRLARPTRVWMTKNAVPAGGWRDEGAVYVIVHHAVYQRCRDAVLKQQEANQKNGQKVPKGGSICSFQVWCHPP